MEEKLENVLLFVIDQTNKIARLYSQREFDLLGININVEQWVVLKEIEEKEMLSQKDLAQFTSRDPASITRTLDVLEKKGLIQRIPVPDNRKQYNIKLTKNGSYFVFQNMPLINHMRSRAIKGFSKKEVENLIAMLQKIQHNLRPKIK